MAVPNLFTQRLAAAAGRRWILLFSVQPHVFRGRAHDISPTSVRYCSRNAETSSDGIECNCQNSFRPQVDRSLRFCIHLGSAPQDQGPSRQCRRVSRQAAADPLFLSTEIGREAWFVLLPHASDREVSLVSLAAAARRSSVASHPHRSRWRIRTALTSSRSIDEVLAGVLLRYRA